MQILDIYQYPNLLLLSIVLDHPPSLVAASIIAYTLRCSPTPVAAWTDTLDAITQYKLEELKPIMCILSRLHRLIDGASCRSLSRRYRLRHPDVAAIAPQHFV